MSWAWLLLIPVLGFFTCCCCRCTSCSVADEEIATFDVTIVNMADGCGTGCTGIDGTYGMTFGNYGTSVCPNAVPSLDTQGGASCCFDSASQPGDVDCSGCPNGESIVDASYIGLLIGSEAGITGAAACAKTQTSVYVTRVTSSGASVGYTDAAFFKETNATLLDCTTTSYNSRNIPAVSVGNGLCDSTSATCTVTRT